MSDYSTVLDPLRDLLDEWGVEHFRAEEFCRLTDPDWDGPRLVCPPQNLICHMSRTAPLADAIREAWGDQVNVVSGYRPPEYNELVGGADGSQHLDFRALDLSPERGDVEDFWQVARAAVEGYAVAVADTGLGLYDWGVHIDTHAEPPNRGHRRWDERSA